MDALGNVTEPLLASLLWLTPAAPPATSAGLGPAAICPADTVLVSGVHHEEVQRVCSDYRRSKCWAFLPGLALSEPIDTTVSVCMDRYEWPNQKTANPLVMSSFFEAETACAERGRRLCSEAEWELACEGPQHRPWPYGWSQQKGSCNVDKRYRGYSPVKLNSSQRAVRDAEARRLWQGAPSGDFPLCESPFGVMDMVGNVEEWVRTSRPQWPYRSSLKGGFWSKAWAGCRGTNERHGPRFRFYEIGFRCCHAPTQPK